jgi:hypothetical protein
MKIEIYIDSNEDKARAAALVSSMNVLKPVIMTIKNVTRTIEQNRQQWPILDAFSKQIKWPVNGEMQLISPEDWKDILTCAYRKEIPRVAVGLDGCSVLLGQRTSKFDKDAWAAWMEFLNWAAIEKGVRNSYKSIAEHT